MKLKNFGSTEQTVYDLVKPIADELGFSIWDVCFEKEGANWYLRIFIDKEGGIDIYDCEEMTRPVNDAIDAADPISQYYILEVGSAGLERHLERTWHFTQSLGEQVAVRSIRPIDGNRDWVGTLKAYENDSITLTCEDGEVTLPLADLSYVKWYLELEF